MKNLVRIIFLGVVLNALTGFAAAGEVLRLATTTSTYETGVLDHILPIFEAGNNCKVHVISVGTGRAIKLGENGDVDVILVHARDAEEEFVRKGYGVNRRDVMCNDFVIVGPPHDPAGIRGLDDAAAAFRRIQSKGCLFVSRGDDSGTHRKELAVWEKAGVDPSVSGHYIEVGQGMNQTLRVADEKNAYCLVDRASYLFNRNALRLKILVEGDAVLLNLYGVIAVSPYRHPHVNYRLSMALIGWLTSPECQKIIADYTKDGNILFYPGAAGLNTAGQFGIRQAGSGPEKL